MTPTTSSASNPAQADAGSSPCTPEAHQQAVTYFIPKDTYTDWRGYERRDWRPNARQALVMAAVEDALAEGLLYQDPLTDAVAIKLDVSAEARKSGAERVQGGDFGMDVYYARRAVDMQIAHAIAEQARAQLAPHVGQKLGVLVFNDFKVTKACYVTEVLDGGHRLKLAGRRGSRAAHVECDTLAVKFAVDRAHDRGHRSEGFDELVKAGMFAAVEEA
jgi:hypothetical protein